MKVCAGALAAEAGCGSVEGVPLKLPMKWRLLVTALWLTLGGGCGGLSIPGTQRQHGAMSTRAVAFPRRDRTDRSALVEARAEYRAKFLGGDGGGCDEVSVGSPLPAFVYNIVRAGQPGPAGYVHHRGIPSATAERLATALDGDRVDLSRCVKSPSAAGMVQFHVANDQLREDLSYGFSAAESECIRERIVPAVEGLGIGPTAMLRVQTGRLSKGHAWQTPSFDEGVRGSLSKRMIQDIVVDHGYQVRDCYEGALAGWPELGGSMSVKLIIGSEGEVRATAAADTTIDNPALECCIRGAIATWSFPPPNGNRGVVVMIPFVLGSDPRGSKAPP